MGSKALSFLRSQAFPLHPFLFGIFPALSLYASNARSIHPTQLLRPIGAGLLLAIVIWSALWLITRNFRRAAIATSFLCLMFYGFAHLKEAAAFVWTDLEASPYETRHAYLVTWAVVTAAVAIALLMVRNPGGFLTRLSNVVGFGLILTSAVQIQGNAARDNEVAKIHADRHTDHMAPRLAAETSPDVFYIVLDGYGRADAMKRYVGFDNSGFLNQLSDRGFYVASESRSNYTQTEPSIASTLNMDWVQNLVGPGAIATYGKTALDMLIEHSRVLERFDQEGYETVYVSTGFPYFQASGADITLMDDVAGMTPFEAALLDLTPVRAPRSGALSSVETKRRYINSAFRHLKRLGWRTSQPKFVFAHILAPHPPFVFEADGSPRTPIRTGMEDGSHFFKNGGTPERYREGYSKQVQYINSLILDTVDSIIERSEVPPVIILQGDHGSKIHHHYDSLEQTVLAESIPILNAYYGPPAFLGKLYPSITPVNSFRLVLNSLFGDDLPLHPDRSFYATWTEPYSLIDVTDMLKSPETRTKVSAAPDSRSTVDR